MQRRQDDDLTFVDSAAPFGPALLLDTCVYVDALGDGLPPIVEALLRTRALIHLSVVIGELSHNFGRLDPRHPKTHTHLCELAEMIGDIPRHRTEDSIRASVLLEAGIVAGLVYRMGGFQPGQEVAALNDACIYLHALDRGYTVLTRNIRDFDYLNQIVPAGRVIFYRQM
jgi:predicted nucleic acid-binding protein